MKFTNGMWLAKEGYRLESPKELYDARVDSEGITLYAPYVRVLHRGNTLSDGMLTLRVESPAENVISVKLCNHMGRRGKKPVFPLARPGVAPQITEDAESYTLQSGGLRLRIGKGEQFALDFWQDGKLLTSAGAKGMGHVVAPGGDCYMRTGLDIGVGENIYGLGERFGPFVKNGQVVETWNDDGGTETEQSYKSIPFFLSSRGYGVLVNHTGRVSYEVGSECVTKTQFSVPGEELEYLVFGGADLKEVLARYAGITGHSPALPVWSFGLWLSTSFTTSYDEETVLSFIDGMLERDIPLSVFHFDCFWMPAYEWCSFIWDKDTFPDPAGLLDKIHQRGIKVCVWINPYIGQKSPMFREGYENDYFVNTGSGDVWQWDRWQAGMALVDFTNPAAKKWYQDKLAALVDMGVDCFKTDFGERIPVQDGFYGHKAAAEGLRYFDGSDPDGMHNWYTWLYNQAVFEVLEQKLGKGNACLFARSATAGSQQFPLHWGGDNLSNYPSMAESLRGGLSFGLSGFSYWSHDIGGFEAGCNPDIYKRWTQFGLLSSHSRYHGNQEYKVPWLYGEEAVAVTRSFSRLKNRLMPYIYSQAIGCGKAGLPMLRAMLLEYPQDPGCLALDRQYMFGDSLLVAPIFNARGEAEYYLPEGLWTNILTGERLQGPGWRRETHGYMALPLLARPNTIVAMGDAEDAPADAFGQQNLALHLYHLEEGATASCVLWGEAGQQATVTANLRDGRLQAELQGCPANTRLVLHDWAEAEKVQGGQVLAGEKTLTVRAEGNQIGLEGLR